MCTFILQSTIGLLVGKYRYLMNFSYTYMPIGPIFIRTETVNKYERYILSISVTVEENGPKYAAI
jgi:hypothetical protein